MNKEHLVHRILVGYHRFKIEDSILILKSPNLDSKYIAEEIYFEKLKEYNLEGCFDEDEYLEFLESRGIWDNKKEKSLGTIRTSIEDMKIELYESPFKSNTRKKLKEKIAKTKKKLEKLFQLKNCEVHKTSVGLAGMAKLRYLIGSSLFNLDGSLVFTDNFWDHEDSGLLDEVVNLYNENQISEAEYRELARTEPWKNIWVCKKACGDNVFSKSSAELSDEQKMLCYWSLLYDNVYEHPDCPTEEVIQDDDALDGFLLKEQRNRTKQKNENIIEDQLSDKVKNSAEVFIVAETPEDAKKIMDMNDDMGQATIKARQNKIQKNKVVNQLELPDVIKKLNMEKVKAQSAAVVKG